MGLHAGKNKHCFVELFVVVVVVLVLVSSVMGD
jgi:hypothetical protein